MTELCKAQCQQNFAGNHQTDELIQKIDQAGKLSELPEKAFDNLSSYLIKQVNDNVHHNDAKIDDSSKSEAFKKALKNQNLSDDEAQKILPTYDELCANNKNSVLPRTLDDKCKQLGTEQDNKQKSSAPFNVQNLLNKLAGGQSLTPFQALYLHRYLSKEQKYMPPHYRVNVDKMLANIPSELVEKATDYQKELIDPKAIEVIGQVIEQIQNEEKRLFDNEFKVPSLGATLKITSQFMEIRPVDGFKNVLTEKMLKEFNENPDNFKFEKNTNFLRQHYGVDFTANNRGLVTYQYGFKVKPEIAKVFDITHSTTKGEATKDLTILEYHPKYGVLLTTFRHLKTERPPYQFNISISDNLSANQKIGTYRIFGTDEKEHVHIERYYADKNAVSTFIEAGEEFKLQQFKTAHYYSINNDNANDDVAKLVQPMIKGNDYHAIALFTPHSDLNNQFLDNLQRKWLVKTSELLNEKEINEVSDIYQFLKNAVLRDQFVLETIAEMLIKVKTLLAQIDKTNSALERLIQIAQQSAIELRDKKVPEHLKIIN